MSENENKIPRWLALMLYITFFGTVGCFIVALFISQMSAAKGGNGLPITYKRLVCVAMICLGVCLEIAFTCTAFKGSFYSGISRRTISRAKEPKQFWIVLTGLALLPIGLILFMVHKLSTL